MSKVTLIERRVKGLRCEAEDRLYVGVDTHKRSYSVSIWSVKASRIIHQEIEPADPESLMDRLAPIRPQIAQVVYEAGPSGFGLARRLVSTGYPAAVVSPGATPMAVVREAKTDRLDSGRLAEYAAKGLLKAIYVPTEEEEMERQVVRLREQMLRRVQRQKVQIKSFLLYHGLPEPLGLEHWSQTSRTAMRTLAVRVELRLSLDLMLDDLGYAEEQLAKITERIRALAATERFAARVERLRTIPGIGRLTAMVVLTELPSAGRFDHAGEVVKMMGLAPQVRQSGETRRGGGLMPSGNRRLRTTLVEAAWRWKFRDERAREQYRRLVRNTGSAQKAIVGVARKLGIIMWRMLTQETVYRATA